MTITFKGKPVTLLGDQVTVGEKAPNFTVLSNDLEEMTLSSFAKTVRLISVIPSIDTGVCDKQTREFNERATQNDNVQVITVSVDLPFAQSRWCAAAGLNNVLIVSDHRDLSFGKAFGVAIKEMRLLTRAVFVIDSNDIITYAEYVEEASNHPNYEAALQAAKKAN